MSATHLSNYLARYAEPDTCVAAGWAAAGLPPVDVAVVVPLLGEAALPDLLWSTLSSSAAARGLKALAVVVVNATAEHPGWVHAANQQTLDSLLGPTARRMCENPGAWWVPFTDSLDLLVVDRARAPWHLKPREGVGHARKIGSDIALALHAAGQVRDRLISTTDADARVALDYFDWNRGCAASGQGLGDCADAAIVHPFRHEVEEGQSPALALYEISLRYYVLGLRYADSPYAFHTIGSTLSFDATAYAAVRGFPKREAAEDFYFLDKLAKFGRIRGGGGEICLVARPSSRVPFGTGRAMHTIEEKSKSGEDFRMYHPGVFFWLRTWLRSARDFAEHGDTQRVRSEIRAAARNSLAPTSESFGCLAEKTLGLLDDFGAFACLETAWRERKQPGDRQRHIFTWFDGLKTLKLIHGLRDRGLASPTWLAALRGSPFLQAVPDLPTLPVPWLEWIRGREQSAEKRCPSASPPECEA